MFKNRQKPESETTKILRPIMNEMARINAVLALIAEKLPNSDDRDQVKEMLARGAHPQSLALDEARSAMSLRMADDTMQYTISPHLSDALRRRREF
jgi:hypothetical protein